MLDAITMERRGLPAAAVGAEKLVMTTGRGMARIQGVPDFPIAIIHGRGRLESVSDPAEIQAVAEEVASQVESILLRGIAT